MKRLEILKSKAAAMAEDTKHEGIAAAFRRFHREEDGSLLIFGLFCFVIMLCVAGMALDLMRFEERRTTLQNTTDRAVLAAADLNQTLDPKAVVKDYFVKAGLTPPKDSEIIINQGAYNEWRTVQAKVNEQLPTWFMNMYGIKSINTPASGTAEERVGQVEISLVLDVSGSMNTNNKIGNLITAANQFVDTMFDSVEPNKLSINLVVYATQVSAGPTLMSYFNVTAEHTDSYCMEFDPADFTRLSVDRLPSSSRVYQRNGHFDPFQATNTTTMAASSWNCNPARNRDIIPFSGDRAALHTYINNLTAGGNTSMDTGMKWGTALLDPSMSGVVDDLVAKGKINGAFGDRPYAYNDKEALKVVVLMTDGENTTEFKLKPGVRSGNSTLMGNTSFASNSTTLNQFSLWDAARGQYYIFALSSWRNEPYGDGSVTSCVKSKCTTTQDPGDAVPMTWPAVWKKISINYFAGTMIKKAYGSVGLWPTTASPSLTTDSIIDTTKDTQTLNMCTAAKNQKVMIFTIGFETTAKGKAVLKPCASSAANFYDVQGLQIQTAFAAIASSINKLRLTQ